MNEEINDRIKKCLENKPNKDSISINYLYWREDVEEFGKKFGFDSTEMKKIVSAEFQKEIITLLSWKLGSFHRELFQLEVFE